MQRGKKQFEVIFFDIEILERYINNPKFLVMDNGYRGTICIKDEFYEEGSSNEYIKDYGMAYIEGEKLNRAIGVFVIDLAKLSPKIQMLWKGFELENQNNCRFNFSDRHFSAFSVFLTEIILAVDLFLRFLDLGNDKDH